MVRLWSTVWHDLIIFSTSEDLSSSSPPNFEWRSIFSASGAEHASALLKPFTTNVQQTRGLQPLISLKDFVCSHPGAAQAYSSESSNTPAGLCQQCMSISFSIKHILSILKLKVLLVINMSIEVESPLSTISVVSGRAVGSGLPPALQEELLKVKNRHDELCQQLSGKQDIANHGRIELECCHFNNCLVPFQLLLNSALLLVVISMFCAGETSPET